MQVTNKDIIATWVYLDGEEEKSKYPNNTVKADSASAEFQAVYWRCVVVFFASSLRFHKEQRHLLFTNAKEVPQLPGLDLNAFFKSNGIEVVHVANKYPLPKGYHANFRNQFFEFSIIEHMAKEISDSTQFLMLDSDCIFSKPFYPAIQPLDRETPARTYVVDHERDYLINGVTGKEMRKLFSHFGLSMDNNPYYSGGEALFANGIFIKNVAKDFPELFKELINLWKANKSKFNEEAHVLSFFYYKYGTDIGGLDTTVKRMWTNANYFRNVTPEDHQLPIWHLPNEKGTGFVTMFNAIAQNQFHFKDQESYLAYCKDAMLNPKNHPVNYYKRFKQHVYLILNKLRLAN
ncbi:Hypothetical protein I595_3522 [Croceitalea dokdonensis DOKDO 023]|uniref:Nucleotide-diphospho-sugar transferase domain-containing protein n=1 Tax=Croceitalea dokdonensis DOKDO 023 TaxID=1300341 RepID=A0A0P7ARC2_9FLAO|nr:hypothetical protein [Croceitalea dokdonensis]KPM30361.1 Hypothetical protein I595_3522 [Croceitalea dokdonensis DOKDO 023]